MSKTYYEAQMIGRIFFANQPTVRSLSDTVICLVSTSLWDSFEQKEPQPSVTRYRHSRHVKGISLLQYATRISSRSRQSASTTSPRQKLQCKTHSRVQYATWMDSSTSHPVIYSEIPQKLPAEGTSMSTVQRSKLPRQGNPTFFGKLSRQLPVYDTLPSSIRRRRKLLGYGTQPSPASYPKLRRQATQSSSTRHHTCNGIDRKIQLRGNSEDCSIVRIRIRYGYSHQV